MRMGLLFAQMLKFYEGAINYDQLMEMPYREFLMYYDYMLYLQRELTEEGQKTNKMLINTDNKRYNKN
jgi:hypothetical protein